MRSSLLALSFFLSLLFLGSACSTPCEELASEVCACEGGYARVDACERRAADQRSRKPPTEADQKRCEAFLETCDCKKLDSAAGKRACGLAE